MRSDSLVPLLAGPPPNDTGFRQGVVVAWDQNTAENLVLVGGTLLENLPALNTSEASILAEGDVVVCVKWGRSWAVLGRVIIPGTAEAASSIQSITNRILAARDGASGTRNSTSFGDLTGANVGPSVTATVGTSGRVLAFWGAGMGFTGSFQEDTGCDVGLELTGANTQAASSGFALGLGTQHPTSPATGAATSSQYIQASNMHLYTGLDPGATTFTMKYRCDNNPSNATAFAQRELALFVL